MPKEDLAKQELANHVTGAATACRILENLLRAGKNLWTVPTNLAYQAREAQRKAQVRKDRKIVRFVVESVLVLCGLGNCRGDGHSLVLSSKA